MRDYTHDTWAPLAHIPELGNERRPTGTVTWLDDVDARRLTAYKVLAAYIDNIRRFWLPGEAWEGRVENVDGAIRVQRSEALNWREYGDAALIVDTARALVLGEDQSITFPDAADRADDAPADPIEAWVEDWAVRERLTQKLLQGEAKTVGLGDGVYVLAPDPGKKRPRLRVYDPGFYFPDTLTVVDGWTDDEFPPIVHLAWEEVDNDGVTWIVRSTWQMRPNEVATPSPWGGDPLPWSCWFRKVRYRLDQLLDNVTVYSPEMSRKAGTVVVQDWTDLLVDFVPVVHVPNTPDEWGTSVLARLVQIIDDMQGTDTDLASGSQTSASPTLVTTGAPAGGLTGMPGEQLGLDPGGSASWLDTSKNLVALTTYLEGLLERLAVNARLGLALLGRIQPNEVPSGVALNLGFHPARQLMRESRTVRDEKYPLILKFALRLAQAAGWAPTGETPDMLISLGASLPADQAAAVEIVKDLLPVHGISTETAVRILVQAGLPIDDAVGEVARIEQENFDAAVKLFEATGNATAAADRLGVQAAAVTLTQQAADQITGTEQ